MEDASLEEARKKKLDAKKAEEQLKTALRLALDETAYNRLMNVAVANKELYISAAQSIMMAFKRVNRKIKEAELVSLLQAIREQNEKKTTITFHKK